MKRFSILLCVAALMALAACSGGGGVENTKKRKPLSRVNTPGEMHAFVDVDGKVAIDLLEYTESLMFSEGLAAVRNAEGNWGFINTNGELVIPCTFKNLNDRHGDFRNLMMFHDGYALVSTS